MLRGYETELTPPERIGLLGNCGRRCMRTTGPVGQYLDLVEAVKDDTMPHVIGTAVGPLGTIEDRIASSREKAALGAWELRTFRPA